LKALIFTPTGGIVAAPTTSLPERPGGTRNWDYRFCWLRDSALTVRTLLRAGYRAEAAAWRGWLLRAVAGSAAQVQTIYGLAGERRLAEWEADWLPGYEGARPVRIGNGAAGQLQIDVFGELMETLHLAAQAGLPPGGDIWALQCALLAQLEMIWAMPDEGIWEVRGGRQHFTHSKVMAWVAFDRAIASATAFDLPGPVDHWRRICGQIHRTVLGQGFNAAKNGFVQSFGGQALDASLLQLPLMGFLPVQDPRIAGTIAAIERELTAGGLLLRYRSEQTRDGLPPGEGVFLACSFWLVEVMALQARLEEAHALFERLLALCNDVGLLAEEYDPRTLRLLGNFPQGFSHLALVDAARRLLPTDR
jgi:GH15 family glucan-1,4-alpha-glucosidase